LELHWSICQFRESGIDEYQASPGLAHCELDEQRRRARLQQGALSARRGE